jgi:hypothetical protein
MLSDIGYSSQSAKSFSGSATLIYDDETIYEKKISLRMLPGSVYSFKQSIYEKMNKYENPVRDKYIEEKDKGTTALAALTFFPFSIPFLLLQKVKGSHPTAIASFATLVPIIILTIITLNQTEGLGLTALGYKTLDALLVYLVVLIPILIVFLFLRRWKIALGIGLSFVVGLPVAFVLLIIGL